MSITRIDRSALPGPLMARTVVAGGVARMCFTPADPAPTLEGQVAQVFARLDEYLAKSGSSRSRLLAAEVWLRNKQDYDAFVPLWNSWVDPTNPPVIALIEARLGRDTVLVEIKVIAAV